MLLFLWLGGAHEVVAGHELRGVPGLRLRGGLLLFDGGQHLDGLIQQVDGVVHEVVEEPQVQALLLLAARCTALCS